MGFRVQGSGFRVLDFGFRVQGSGFIQGSRLWVQVSEFRAQGFGFSVQCSVGFSLESQGRCGEGNSTSTSWCQHTFLTSTGSPHVDPVQECQISLSFFLFISLSRARALSLSFSFLDSLSFSLTGPATNESSAFSPRNSTGGWGGGMVWPCPGLSEEGIHV